MVEFNQSDVFLDKHDIANKRKALNANVVKNTDSIKMAFLDVVLSDFMEILLYLIPMGVFAWLLIAWGSIWMILPILCLFGYLII